MSVPVYVARLTMPVYSMCASFASARSTGHHPTLNGYGLMPFPCLCFPCTVCDNKERITIVQVTLLVANLNLVVKAPLRYSQGESSVSLSHIVTVAFDVG